METAIPQDFEILFRNDFPSEDFDSLYYSLEQELPQGAIRPNRKKHISSDFFDSLVSIDSSLRNEVSWHKDAVLLGEERPIFASHYLWQGGYCYVQEPSSMVLSLLSPYLSGRSLRVLDLCAAPGGKSTLLIDLLPLGSVLIANEPIPKRTAILKENLLRWGYSDTIVTQAYPRDFLKSGLQFDLILVDAPCSGEGMFRKSESARRDWSLDTVRQCVERQREILDVALQLLTPEGILAYSTCTFNKQENEENARYILEKEPFMELLPLVVSEEWGFVRGEDSLGFHAFPHHLRGEGLYFVAFRKRNKGVERELKRGKSKEPSLRTKGSDIPQSLRSYLDIGQEVFAKYSFLEREEGSIYALSPNVMECYSLLQKAKIPLYHIGIPFVEKKGKMFRPHSLLPFSMVLNRDAFDEVEIDEKRAKDYFRGEALTLESMEKKNASGIVLLTCNGLPIGFSNATGGRLNNLFPKIFRLKKGLL